MSNAPIDAFHRHEVLHTALVIAELFEQRIAGHRFTQSDDELKAAAERLSGQLYDFYQLVGARIPAEQQARERA